MNFARQPSGSFYHQYAWSQVNSAALGHQSIFLIARRGSEICGILPLTLVSSALFGRIRVRCLSSTMAAPARAMLWRRCAGCRGPGGCAACAKSEVPRTALQGGAADRHAALEAQDQHAHRARSGSRSAVWTSFATKHRTNIRRSLKNGLEVRRRRQDLLNTVLQDVMEHRGAMLGTPFYGRSYFESILRELPGSSPHLHLLARHRPGRRGLQRLFQWRRRRYVGRWHRTARGRCKRITCCIGR